MISYIVNLFMVQTDLRGNNGYSKSFKKRHFVYVCMFFPISSKDCFHVVRWLFIHLCNHHSRLLRHSYINIVRLL